MTNYVRRLIYIDAAEKQKINPLFYPFLFASLLYALGFTFLGWWTGVSTSSLHTAMTAIHVWLPEAWGVVTLVAVVFALILLLGRRWANLGEYAAMMGFLVWTFAAMVYILNGYWLVLLSVALPNAFFWCYYYVRVKWYERQKDAGLLIDAG